MVGAAPGKQRLGFLDIARGLAALLVLAEHSLDEYLPGCVRSSLGHGNLGKAGVLLFLLISGFIIPASLEQGGSNARFWLRRFFRLFPAYWLSIAVAYGYCCRSGQFVPEVPAVATGDWLLNLTMLQGFFGRPNVWGVFWTLQLELVIYVACSLLFAVRLLRRPGWIAGVALTAYAALALGRPLLEGKPLGVGGGRFIYFAPLLGLVTQRYWAGQLSRGMLIAVAAGQALVLAGTWWANHALFPAQITSACLWELTCTWGIAGAAFFVLLGVRHRAMPSAGCWLGRVSYSVYLLHPFVLMVLRRGQAPAWVLLPAFLAATLVLAEVAYRCVEAPGVALGRVIERRWFPVAAKPAQAASPFRRAA